MNRHLLHYFIKFFNHFLIHLHSYCVVVSKGFFQRKSLVLAKLHIKYNT